METQTHMEMAHRENQEERTKELVEEITEEQFLKDLYLFMKKRDTPIERIPHLGFKQIDLFVMFKTVRDLGGYHQVTAQQLWKQVYNKLGGNPRSTSAATCTRRHYEKLLLPYECHVKGVLMNALPQHQQKHFPYANYNKDDEDGQRPTKRKLLSIRLHQQSPHNLPSAPHGSVFSVPHHYSHYYHPSHVVLPPYVPISSSALTPHTPPAPEPQFAFRSSCPNPADRVREPLEHLRHLAEQYKTSSGLNEPLNLSVKAPSQETNRNPASSFAPPSSSKNPKFLNKPSPLYTLRSQVMINEECDTQDGEADGGVTPYSYPAKAGEAYVIDVRAITASSSPTHDSAPTVRTDEGAKAMAQKPSSPKTDSTVRSNEEWEGSPEVGRLSLSHTPPSLPHDNGEKMEIQIPLSMFNTWLRLYGSSAMMHVAEQLHTQEEHSGQRNYSMIDILPTNLSFHMNTQNLNPAPEDLSMRRRKVPSPTPAVQATANHHSTSQNHFTSSKPLRSGGLLKNASIRDVYPVDQQDIMTSYSSKSPNSWDAYDKETHASHIHGKTDSSPVTAQQDFTATKSYNEDAPVGGKERSETGPTAVLMVNSGSASLLHLTTEEVMKLKKIISSSS